MGKGKRKCLREGVEWKGMGQGLKGRGEAGAKGKGKE